LVFIYGTLRRAASEGARMTEVEHLGMRTLQGPLSEIDSKPALVRSEDVQARVLGDLYRVRADQLEEIDRWHERIDGMEAGGCYSRAQEPILAPGDRVKSKLAWVWRWTGPTEGQLPFPQGSGWMWNSHAHGLSSPVWLPLLWRVRRS
jgi:gamma-glutamylcyclotransferase (GGCT)/AIG2-like uncharacterized protein YtfP